MEKTSSHYTMPSNLLDLFSLHIVFNLIHNISSSFLSYFPFFHSRVHLFGLLEVKPELKRAIYEDTLFDEGNKELISSRESSSDNENCMCRRDIHLVMEKLGIKYTLEEDLQNKWGSNEICGIFEEEPSLEEVKEAFGVFDQNKDGFIDAWELQRVLCVLGLSQGKELNACNKMIKEFDENDDGKIDFNEFVRLMLKSF